MGGIRESDVIRILEDDSERVVDSLAVESPLSMEIIHQGKTYSLGITMRTPGQDADLSIGFLYSEGIIESVAEIEEIEFDNNNISIKLNETEVFDYQIDYFDAWQKHHKLILNKSRKIGATETALRIIAYNCLRGNYSGHRVMIVAGNKQDVANRFIQRFKSLFTNGFTDLTGKEYTYEDIITKEDSKSCLVNNAYVQAYPSNESVRGEENVKCVFMSECAFINLIDDTKVYNALHPNVANISDADFIMESTPNGKRGFFWTNYDANSEYHKLDQPYTVSLGMLLDEEFIKKEKANPKIDFEQEYCCLLYTSDAADE